MAICRCVGDGCQGTRAMGATLVELDGLRKPEPLSVLKPGVFPGRGSLLRLLPLMQGQPNFYSCVLVPPCGKCKKCCHGLHCELSFTSRWLSFQQGGLCCPFHKGGSTAPMTSYQTFPPILATSCTLFSWLCLLRCSKPTGIGT